MLASKFKSNCIINTYECTDEAMFFIDQARGEVSISQAKSEDTCRMKKTQIWFLGNAYEQIIIQNINSDSVLLVFTGRHAITKPLEISMIKAEEFQVINLRNNAGTKILMEFISANNISFGSIHNDGMLVLRYFEPESVVQSGKFHLGNSYLGNCDLYHVDFAA